MTAQVTEKLLDGAAPLTPVQPNPDRTPDELVAAAAALRDTLRQQQDATEERTYYSQDIHQAIEDAGLYRIYVPRMFGGYEFGVPTYLRSVIEIARGCMSSGWCYALATSHALQIASWWPEQAQREIFGAGDFRAAGVAAPVGPAIRTSDGWSLTGKVSFASGIPVSTHFLGQALLPPAGNAGPPTPVAFVAPRNQFDIVDDWGYTLGLKGSGSHSVRFDNAQLPEHFVLENFDLLNPPVDDGTVGLRLHNQPLYAGRTMGVFVMTLSAVVVGGAYLALDEYREVIANKLTPLPPFRPRLEDPDYQRWYGEALTKIASAEAMLIRIGEHHMQFCERAAAGGAPFSRAEDLLLCTQAREVIEMARRVVTEIIVPTAGATALSNGTRIERVFRDLGTASSHRNMMLKDWFLGETARETLGIVAEPSEMPSR